jgi:hypothetical protein
MHSGMQRSKQAGNRRRQADTGRFRHAVGYVVKQRQAGRRQEDVCIVIVYLVGF